MKNRKNLGFTGIILLMMIISSCKKNETIAVNETDRTTLMENVQVDEMVTDNFTEIIGLSLFDLSLFESSNPQISNGISVIEDNLNGAAVGCKTISVSPSGNVFPRTVTIDFGQGCTEGGKTRKGKMISVFTGKLKDVGSTVSTTYENFYVNDDRIEGTKTIVNNGPNANGKVSFTVTVNHTRNFTGGGSATHSSVKTFTWLEGYSSNLPLDDIFAITGADSGSDSNGKTFSTTTIKPLIKKVACPFIVAGKLQINKSGRPTQVIDYGDGTCDAKATVTVNGETKEISLKK